MGVSEAPAEAQSREILDALTGVVKQAAAISHSIAAGLGLTPPDLLALFKMDFGGLYQKNHPSLHVLKKGFLSKAQGWDDVTYWLFEKRA